jgi:hypothetical protein
MMHDNLDPHVSGQADPATGERAESRDESATDREVPVAAANTPAIIHAWLDGEPVNQTALQAAGGYAFWSRVKSETDRRRRMHTPTPVSGAIMEAIRKEG